jgi:hypothetical protein
MNTLLLVAQAGGSFSLWGLVVLVVKILVVCLVAGLLLWAIGQFPAPAAPLGWIIQALRVIIIVCAVIICLVFLLAFIGIAM